MSDIAIFFSIVSLGFFGSFTHCTFMCGPFVATQVANRLKELDAEEYTLKNKILSNLILFYHLGRSLTYASVSYLLYIFTVNLKTNKFFHLIMFGMTIIASLIFLNIFLDNKISSYLTKKFQLIKSIFFNKTLLKKIFKFRIFNKIILFFYEKTIKYHSNNDSFVTRNLNSFIAGLVLGFLPCGLLYEAYFLSNMMTKGKYSFLAMFIYGLITIPGLFLSSFGLNAVMNKLVFFRKIISFINFLMLLVLSIILLNYAFK